MDPVTWYIVPRDPGSSSCGRLHCLNNIMSRLKPRHVTRAANFLWLKL